jgi:hypothetical protein
MSSLSQIAPEADLPIFLPSDVVRSGVVSPKISASSTRRVRSIPLTILPHWSEPPNCTRQP